VVIDSSQENLNCFVKYSIKTVCADLSQRGGWEEEFVDVDYLINLAAQISAPEYEPFHRNSVLATRNLIDVARKKVQGSSFISVPQQSYRYEWMIMLKQM
jgi:nucleoside-diphosphate-sugar epimerase